MPIKALIFDFDNTVFPVPSIGPTLFAPLFELIEEDGNHSQDMDKIKDDVMRIPFQAVADRYNFSQQLKESSIQLLQNLTYNGSISTFDDYGEILKIPGERFLVTAGFLKMQSSKIDAIGIRKDFKKVIIIDPDTTSKTKKDVFAEIMRENNYTPGEVMVIGDDPNSEIKFANQLGMPSVLYDKEHRHPDTEATHTINHYQQLINIVNGIG